MAVASSDLQSPPRRWRWPRSIVRALPIVAFVLTALPFVDRPLSIDEPLYVQLGQWIEKHPLDPLGGSSFWHERPARFFDDLYNPPLVGYLLAATSWLHGYAVLPMRALMMAVGVIALILGRAVIEERGADPRWIFVMALSPAFSVTALTVGTDGLFLAFSLAAILAAQRQSSVRAGLWGSFGVLTKYVGGLWAVLLIPFLKQLRHRIIAAGLIVATMVLWAFVTETQYGRSHVLAAARFQSFSGGLLIQCGLAFVSAVGLAGGPLLVCAVPWRNLDLAAAVIAGTVVWSLESRSALALLAFVMGFLLLLGAVRCALEASDRSHALAFAAFAMYSVALVYFFAVRYLLPLMVPLVALYAGATPSTALQGWRWRWSLIGSAILSLVCLRSDAFEAERERDLAQSLPLGRSGFQTGRWGFSHYASERGYMTLDPRRALDESGSHVVAMPSELDSRPLSRAQRARLGKMDGTELAPNTGSWPWRFMDKRANAGWHSSAWGSLPFAWRSGESEPRVTLYSTQAWIQNALALFAPLDTELDVGSSGSETLLDGWSDDERATGRTFVWGLGQESALRVTVPENCGEIEVVAFPSPEAIGTLRVRIGESASASLELKVGWNRVHAQIQGRCPQGPTTIVLAPAGHHEPGRWETERRPLSVAVDMIRISAPSSAPHAATESLGVFPILNDARPALFMSGTFDVAPQGRTMTLEARGGLFRNDEPVPCAVTCSIEIVPSATPTRLRAENAVVTGVTWR